MTAMSFSCRLEDTKLLLRVMSEKGTYEQDLEIYKLIQPALVRLADHLRAHKAQHEGRR